MVYSLNSKAFLDHIIIIIIIIMVIEISNLGGAYFHENNANVIMKKKIV